ncbi:cyclodeaminase/cyclohydrolase family protein [Streptomyces sp. NPDC001292]|uniref:cyclodeaminase/cyclohydrolase family protein n=1 Tax=Streptomyces sp. NPDC001292 TaxID=3364558 RepID=UPI0036C65D7E
MTALADDTVAGFLNALAARTSAPSAGAAAALTAGAAAALAAMAARFSDSTQSEFAEHADRLRAEVLSLADADGVAYAAVLEAVRLPRTTPDRRERIGQSLLAATEVPLRIAEKAAEIATLAARTAVAGNPRLSGDAQAGALLAEGATRAAARIVWINRDLGGLDATCTERAEGCLKVARQAVTAATGSTP